MSGLVREVDGITVTLREQTTGDMHTVVERGHVKDALSRVCHYADVLEGDWKIVSISTPSSIYRDLHGHRGQHREEGKDRDGSYADPRSAEVNMLGQIGRVDMLQPLRQAGYDGGAGRIA